MLDLQYNDRIAFIAIFSVMAVILYFGMWEHNTIHKKYEFQ